MKNRQVIEFYPLRRVFGQSATLLRGWKSSLMNFTGIYNPQCLRAAKKNVSVVRRGHQKFGFQFSRQCGLRVVFQNLCRLKEGLESHLK